VNHSFERSCFSIANNANVFH